jgi:tRNA splicing endonuclease
MSKLSKREKIEFMALAFLANGPDSPGPIIDENVLSAYLLYLDLRKRGYVESTGVGEGMAFSITQSGLDFLSSYRGEVE